MVATLRAIAATMLGASHVGKGWFPMAAPDVPKSRPTGWKRPAHVFISYSRSEAMLVEYLGERLRDRSLRTWLDFQNLEPGTPWQEQLDAGVDDADIVVLVVSERAVASEHVASEWKRALAQGKQVVLYVAQAVPIPEQLRGLPWIDGRTRSSRSADHLADLVEARRAGRASEAVDAPPDHGFRAPARVWFAFAASIPTALAACFAFWTLILPVVLVPLPFQILRHSIVGFGPGAEPPPDGEPGSGTLQRAVRSVRLGWRAFSRRTFNYTDVRNALLALPIAATFSAVMIDPDGEAALPLTVLGVAYVAAPATFLLIRGGSFRRWAKPAAARPVRRRETSLIAREPRRVTYRIDAAPADRKYANVIEAVLATHGHVVGDEAEVVIRVVSQYHDIADVDAFERTIPIVVADADDRLPEHLSRTQWIDLRRGADRHTLDALARYLDEPAALFQDIGNPPPHEQRVLPRGVQALFVTLWAAVSMVIGVFVLVVIGGALDGDGTSSHIGAAIGISTPIGAATVAAMLWMTRSLRTRRPGRLPHRLVWFAAIGNLITLAPITAATDVEADGVLPYVVGASVIALTLMSVLLVVYRYAGARAIDRWLPTLADAKLSASLATAATVTPTTVRRGAGAPGDGAHALRDGEALPPPTSLPWPTTGDRAADVVRSPPRAVRRQPGEQHQQSGAPDV